MKVNGHSQDTFLWLYSCYLLLPAGQETMAFLLLGWEPQTFFGLTPSPCLQMYGHKVARNWIFAFCALSVGHEEFESIRNRLWQALSLVCFYTDEESKVQGEEWSHNSWTNSWNTPLFFS